MIKNVFFKIFVFIKFFQKYSITYEDLKFSVYQPFYSYFVYNISFLSSIFTKVSIRQRILSSFYLIFFSSLFTFQCVILLFRLQSSKIFLPFLSCFLLNLTALIERKKKTPFYFKDCVSSFIVRWFSSNEEIWSRDWHTLYFCFPINACINFYPSQYI